jgi:hypothetical protein
MNEDVKEKWIAALRSGEYPQTSGVLRDQTGYCCLGVLCEIAVKEGVASAWEPSPDNAWSFAYGKQDERDKSFLPPSVQRWAGVDLPSPEVPVQIFDDEVGISLSALNDRGTSFEEIADLIEEYL